MAREITELAKDVRVVIEQDDKRIVQVMDIHMNTFQGFFLSFLGPGFLKQLYKGYVEHPESGLLIAEDEKRKVLGFLAYSEDNSGFY